MSKLTLSVEDSPAKTSASQGEEKALKESGADSGLSSTGSSRKSGRATRSSKTSQPFAIEDWTKCSGGSLRSGMMRNGIVYPLPPLVPLTKGTASGLWPTPTASDCRGGATNGRDSELKHYLKRRYGGVYPHPTFVEGLMGFPIGWTDLSNSETP